MSKDLIGSVSAKIKNIFQSGNFQSRKDDGSVRVTTDSAREVEGKEAFPYGFYAKAKKGVVTVLCSGGSFDAVRILPVENSEDVPELEDGDVAIYTSGGSLVTCRADGTVEINGTDYGGIIIADELKKQLDKMTARIDGIIDALKNAPTAAQDGGASYKGGIVGFLSALADKENFSDIQTDTVLHGKGKS